MFTKIKNFILSPINMMIIALTGLALAFIDAVTSPNAVTGFSDLRMLGKVSLTVFCVFLAILLFFYLVVPFAKWFVSLVK